MNEFKTYHPIVNFIYYICVIGFSMFFMHPVFLGISLVAAVIASFMIKGRKKTVMNMAAALPLLLCAAVLNPAFNHEGATILAYFPSGNPFTAESLIYGVAAAIMLAAVLFHFSCYNDVMTSDKFVYLFGKAVPVLSLVLSMALRFVPRLVRQAREIAAVQKAMGRDIYSGSIVSRCRHGAKIFSMLITWALETSIEVSDSMKSRGYGLGGRTAYSIYRFDKRDAAAFIWIAVNALVVIFTAVSGSIRYRYFPTVEAELFTPGALAGEIAYLLLCSAPIIIELRHTGFYSRL